jgi:hypothetical protein
MRGKGNAKEVREKIDMATTLATEKLAKQKLEAFELLQPEFEASFHFVQEVHGQRRFSTFPVMESVRYLHALWICECKDRLLSVYKNIERFEGRYCLDLLRRWQEGDIADVVAFLHAKLDGFPFVELTHQIMDAKTTRSADDGLVRRLIHGRLTLLNRSMNLMQALDAIFALSEDDLINEVLDACAHYGHTSNQIELQLTEMLDPLYSYVPNRLLAQRNMLVMNKLGVNVMKLPTDRPGERSWKVAAPTEPMPSFAMHTIGGYLELVSPLHNNVMRYRFFDRPEIDRDGFRV